MVRIGPETIATIQIVEFIKQTTDIPVIHIANEGKRSYAMGSILVRMGLMKGVSDLFFPRSSSDSQYKGIWLEVKIGKGKPSPEQIKFIDSMYKEGYMGICCWGSEEGINILKRFYDLS